MKKLQYLAIFLLMSSLLTSCDEYDSYEHCVDSQHHHVCSSSTCKDRVNALETKSWKQCFEKNPCSKRKVDALMHNLYRCKGPDEKGCSDSVIEKQVKRIAEEHAKNTGCKVRRADVCAAYVNRMTDTINCVSKECRIKTAKLCSKYPREK